MGKSTKSNGQVALSSGAALRKATLFTAFCRPDGDSWFYEVTVYRKGPQDRHWRVELLGGSDAINPLQATFTNLQQVRQVRRKLVEKRLMRDGWNIKFPAHALLPDIASGFVGKTARDKSVFSQLPAGVRPVKVQTFSEVLVRLASSSRDDAYGMDARARHEFAIQLFADQLVLWVEENGYQPAEFKRRLDQHIELCNVTFGRKLDHDAARVIDRSFLPESVDSQD